MQTTVAKHIMEHSAAPFSVAGALQMVSKFEVIAGKAQKRDAVHAQLAAATRAHGIASGMLQNTNTDDKTLRKFLFPSGPTRKMFIAGVIAQSDMDDMVEKYTLHDVNLSAWNNGYVFDFIAERTRFYTVTEKYPLDSPLIRSDAMQFDCNCPNGQQYGCCKHAIYFSEHFGTYKRDIEFRRFNVYGDKMGKKGKGVNVTEEKRAKSCYEVDWVARARMEGRVFPPVLPASPLRLRPRLQPVGPAFAWTCDKCGSAFASAEAATNCKVGHTIDE